MATQDDGRGPRQTSARARSLMAAASLLGLSLGVGVANAADTGAPAVASDQIKHAGSPEDAARRGHYIKMDSNQIKGESADANHIKWKSDQIKGDSTDAASHQIKIEGK